MEKLLEDLRVVTLSEYERAAAVHGPLHNSPHEACAVILEEVEEAKSVIEYELNTAMVRFWNAVKQDFDGVIDPNEAVSEIKDAAIQAAAELIQVAVTAHKTTLGYVTEINWKRLCCPCFLKMTEGELTK